MREQALGQEIGCECDETIRGAGSDTGFSQAELARVCRREHAAEPAREIEAGGNQVTRAGAGVTPGEIRGFLGAEPGRQHKRYGGLGCGGDGLQLLHVVLVEWIGTWAVDQHRARRTWARQGLGNGNRVRRHNQREAEQTRVGGELLGCASALTVGGHHGRRRAGEHGTSRQAGCGEGFARAGRTDKHQRPISRQRGECQGVRERAGERMRVMCREAGGECGRNAMTFQTGGCLVLALVGVWVKRLERSEFFLGFLKCGCNLHTRGEAAGGEDQGVGAEFGADARQSIANPIGAIQLEAHGVSFIGASLPGDERQTLALDSGDVLSDERVARTYADTTERHRMTEIAWHADPLVWGNGPRVFEAFLEPTCPYSVRAFGKLDDLLTQAGGDRITVKVRLHSQPWHMYSGVIVRCILAASTLPGGKETAKAVMSAIAAHREEFEFERHCRGPNLDVTPNEIIRRIEGYSGVALAEAFAIPNLDREIKWHTKYSRQNGIHVSPTFMIDGLVQPDMGSGDAVADWAARLLKS